jgi:hypothetical protein
MKVLRELAIGNHLRRIVGDHGVNPETHSAAHPFWIVNSPNN